jgi:hypothetical protein
MSEAMGINVHKYSGYQRRPCVFTLLLMSGHYGSDAEKYYTNDSILASVCFMEGRSLGVLYNTSSIASTYLFNLEPIYVLYISGLEINTSSIIFI